MRNQLETLLTDVDETDNIHDIVFRVGKTNFPAHRFILGSISPYFRRFFAENRDKTIEIRDVDENIFRELLTYVYTGRCELTELGELKNRDLRNLCRKQTDENGKKGEKNEENTEETDLISAYEHYKRKSTKNKTTSAKHPLRMLQEVAKRFECKTLQRRLNNLEADGFFLREKTVETVGFSRAKLEKTGERLTFNRVDFEDFYDVKVKCRDGREMGAHKCILSARLEYFGNMFSARWQGVSIFF